MWIVPLTSPPMLNDPTALLLFSALTLGFWGSLFGSVMIAPLKVLRDYGVGVDSGSIGKLGQTA